jgi:hypothetical protein
VGFAIDANGDWTWGTLEKRNPAIILRKIIPAAWLDTAVYPVIVDATFGYESIGATKLQMSANTIMGAGPFSPSSSGSATDVVYYGTRSSSGHYTFGLYDDDGTGALPDNLLGDDDGSTPGTGYQWHTRTLDASAAVVSGADYWIVFRNQYAFTPAYDTVSGFARRYLASTAVSGVLPDPFPGPAFQSASRKYSCYVIYTETSAGPPIPVVQHHRRMQR